MIKLKLISTGKKQSFKRLTWERSQNDPDLWEVIDEGDPVLMLQITAGVGRKELYFIDKEDAERIVNNNTDKYTFVSIDEAETLIPKIPFDPEKINFEANKELSEGQQVVVSKANPEIVNKALRNELKKSEFPEPDHDMEKATTNHEEIIKSLRKKPNKLAKFSFPKLQLELWNINFSLLWFSISVLTFFGGFYLSYFKTLYSDIPFKFIEQWDERAFWLAAIGMVSTATFFITKATHHPRK
ncbi:MAG: hypothetical protein ABJH98_18025 [Reichenbachiella sp.]|uniref:hypothetical protein n=1 Tax=Reichenbachiella sp. TaxID=2184521 RepID=UPI003299D778